MDNLGPLSQALDAAPPSAAEHVPEALFDVQPKLPAAPRPPAAAPDQAALSDSDRRILDALATGPLSVDGVVDATALPASSVQASLMLLGIKSFVKRSPDGRFERKR